MSNAQAQSQARREPRLLVLATLLLLAAAPGCRAGSGPFARWRGADSAPNLSAEAQEARNRDLLTRWLTDPSTNRSPESDSANSMVLGRDGGKSQVPAANDPEIAAEFAEAERLFLQGDLAEAEKAFARIDRKHGRVRLSFSGLTDNQIGERDPFATRAGTGKQQSPWGMKALYYLAEIKFQRGDYVGAHDKFEELIKNYPGTNYLEKAVAREHEIAQIWLSQSNSEIETESKLPWYARFNGGLPFIDTSGHALQTLEHVRLNDPTGPLADRATKDIADHYFRKGDYESAAVYYDQLVNEYPKSPLLHSALLASIDSKMKSYIGPEYDFKGLEEARATTRKTLQMFPERLVSTGDELYQTLDLIADQEAERDYTVGSYYRRAGKVVSAEYYFGKIVAKWPKSEWAAKAKVQLAELAEMPRKESLPSKILVQPGSDPYANGITPGNPGGMGGMGGMMPGLGGP